MEDPNMLPAGPLGHIAGTSEYLNTLVDRTGKCRCISPRSMAGDNPELPNSLSFFSETAVQEARNYNTIHDHPGHVARFLDQERGPFRPPVMKLDTRRICKDCYDKAVPDGFNTWSIEYSKRTDPWGKFPPQIPAGSPIDAESFVKPRTINLPSPDARIIFSKMAHDGRPFYIDLLNGETKWRKLDDHLEREKQNAAISKENGPAYISANTVYRAHGDFGGGQNTTAEHRVASDRLSYVNPNWQLGDTRSNAIDPELLNESRTAADRIGNSAVDHRHTPRHALSATPGAWEEFQNKVQNADAFYPENLPKRMLTTSRVDKVESYLTGLLHPTPPSLEERMRFDFEAKEREKWEEIKRQVKSEKAKPELRQSEEHHRYLTRSERIDISNSFLREAKFPESRLPSTYSADPYKDPAKSIDEEFEFRRPPEFKTHRFFLDKQMGNSDSFYGGWTRQVLAEHHFSSRLPRPSLERPPGWSAPTISDDDSILKMADWSESGRVRRRSSFITIKREDKSKEPEYLDYIN